MALEMQGAISRLQTKWLGQGVDVDFRVRMSINTGVATVGKVAKLLVTVGLGHGACADVARRLGVHRSTGARDARALLRKAADWWRCPICGTRRIWEKDKTPSAYAGRKHPPSMVTAAIIEAIEMRRHEIIVAKHGPQLIAARWLCFFAPPLLRAGMAWMEPVPPDVVERARQRQRLAPDAAPTWAAGVER